MKAPDWVTIPQTVRLTVLALLLFTTGCGAADISRYRDMAPQLDVIEYFSGTTRGWGIVQDRGGTVTRQFVVDICGWVNTDGNLVLEEDFSWNDGKRSRRVWTITRNEDQSLHGVAEDVVGQAIGAEAGNALNWRYRLALDIDGTTWVVSFDDWMFLQPNGVLLNKARMSKFGIRVGEVTIAFHKQPDQTRN